MHNSLYVAYHFMSTCIVTMHTASRCCYLLLHTIQFTICCHIPHSCCLLASHAIQLLLVSYHLLPHAAQYTICCHVPYSCYWCCILCNLPLLPHSVQFNIHYRMPCGLLFVVACAIQLAIHCCYQLPRAIHLLSIAACHTVTTC